MKQLKEDLFRFIELKRRYIFRYIYFFFFLTGIILLFFPLIEKWLLKVPSDFLNSENALIGNAILLISYLIFLGARHMKFIEFSSSFLLKSLPVILLLEFLFITKANYEALPTDFFYKYYFALVFFLLVELYQYIISFRPPKDKKNDSFIKEDVPWKKEEDNLDLLNFQKRAKLLAKEINKMEAINGAISIGINGKWGVGKSSFINMLITDIKDNPNIIYGTFSPWINNNKITYDFLKTFQKLVSPFSYDLNRAIGNYSIYISKVDSSGISNLTRQIFEPEKTFTEHIKHINKLLEKHDKKIVIIIDDIDRLVFSEILEVFKLIRNTANLKNTIFVSAYDYDYIINTLEKNKIHDPKRFTEKIFQFEVVLFPPTEVIGPNYLFIELGKQFPDKPVLLRFNINGKKNEATKEVNNVNFFALPPTFINFLSIIRNGKRAFNNISFAVNNVHRSVKLDLLLLLEILKLENFGLYSTIDEASKSFEQSGQFDASTGTDTGVELSFISIIRETFKRKNEIPVQAKSATDNQQEGSTSNNVEVIDELDQYNTVLSKLFDGEGCIDRSELKIYTSYLDPDSSNAVFQPTQDNMSQVIQNLEELKKRDLLLYNELFLKVQQTYFDKPITAEQLAGKEKEFAKIIFYLYDNSEYSLVDKTDKLLQRATGENLKKAILDELLNFGQRDLKRLSNLIEHISLSAHRSDEYLNIFSNEEIENLSVKILEGAINNEYDYITIENCYTASIKSIDRETSKIKLIPKAGILYRKYIETKPEEFFKYLIRITTRFDNEAAVFYVFIWQAFDNDLLEVIKFFRTYRTNDRWGDMGMKYLSKYIWAIRQNKEITFNIDPKDAEFIQKNRPEFGIVSSFRLR